MLEYFLYYLIIINILTFIIYGIDKEKCKKMGQWRISESILLLLAVVGGSFGAWFGMRKFHHKSQKIRNFIFRFR